MSKAIQTCEWFPKASRLIEYGEAAPPQAAPRLPSAKCDRCDGVGFEYVDGYGPGGAPIKSVRPCVCRPVPVAK